MSCALGTELRPGYANAVANEPETEFIPGMTLALRDSTLTAPADYLAALNAEQRSAVEHGEGKV
ncbi:hypothetical protein AB4144_50990, partial [Rhizobiaceae sp. 2RAB30]